MTSMNCYIESRAIEHSLRKKHTMSIAPTKLSKSELDLIVVALNHGDTATLKRAFDANRFIDSRLKQPYLNALNDTDEYGDGTQLAEFVADKVIPSFGTKIYKDVQKAFNSKGDQSDAYRVKILHRLDPAKTKPIVVLASEKGAESVQIAAIECLGDHPDTFDLLMKLSKHHGLKWQAERSIAQLGTPAGQSHVNFAQNQRLDVPVLCYPSHIVFFCHELNLSG
jgi:hypothetical protein